MLKGSNKLRQWVYGVTTLLLWTALMAHPLSGAEHTGAVTIDPSISRMDLTPFLSFFEDTEGNLPFKEVRSPQKTRNFKPLGSRTGFGYSSSTFWFKCTIENRRQDSIPLILEYPYPAIDHIELYYPQEPGPTPSGFHKTMGGDTQAFVQTSQSFRTFAVPVSVPPGDHTFYFMLRSKGALVPSLRGWGADAFNTYQQKDIIINWLYYGAMLSVCIFCVLIFARTKDPIFLSLLLFVFGTALFSMVHTGMAAQYLWPGMPIWSNRLHPLSGFIGCLGFLLYSRTILSTQAALPQIDRWFKFLARLNLLLCVISMAIPYSIATQAMILFTGITICVTAGTSVTMSLKGNRQAKIYFLALLPFIVSIILMALKSYGFLQNNLLTDSMVQITSSAVCVLLCFGVIDKINQVQEDRKHALVELNRAESKYRLLAENIKDVIWILDLSSLKLVYITPSIEAMMGYTPKEAAHFSFTEMLPPQAGKRAMTAVKEGIRQARESTGKRKEAFTIELECYHKKGHIFWTETTTTFTQDAMGKPVEMIGVTRDITSRKQAEKAKDALEQKLHQSGKLEALGTLAGGIAHDMNNIIAAILGYAQISQYDTDPDTRLNHRINRIIKACHRAKDLVGHILTFSRQDSDKAQVIKIHLIVKEVLKLIRATLPATITIESHIEDKSLMVNIDPTQLHRIIMNLCTNAWHAMQDSGGILGLGLEKVILDEHTAGQYINLTPGEYVRLTVSDTGHGMEDKVLQRVFEPFFTTKPTGLGTGLGLSMVHGIVKKSGGDIFVYSEPDKGTAFHLLFPNVTREPAQQETTQEEVPGGSESILYVDDEEYITDMAVEMLSDLGYRVIASNSSEDALALFNENPGDIDLLITDQTMPNLTGMDLADKIRETAPDLPIILCTGFSELMTPERIDGSGINQYIMKPFTQNDLAARIRTALDKPA